MIMRNRMVTYVDKASDPESESALKNIVYFNSNYLSDSAQAAHIVLKENNLSSALLMAKVSVDNIYAVTELRNAIATCLDVVDKHLKEMGRNRND